MKLLTFASDAGMRFGSLASDGETVVDLQATEMLRVGVEAPELVDALSFLEAGEVGREIAERAHAFATEQRPEQALCKLADVALLSPVPVPRSIRDCMASKRHVVQAMRGAVRMRNRWLAGFDLLLERCFGRGLIKPPKVWFKQPVYYRSNPYTVVGSGAEVIWPGAAERMDYELEIGVFVCGSPAANLSVEDAKTRIGGYTIFNDFSARDLQMPEMSSRLGPAKGKNFDTGNAIGPYLVTPDEFPDGHVFEGVARINGQVWSRGSSADMRYSFAELISYMSRDETIHAGEFIGSGTFGGGCGLELDRWLSPGDVVELDVDGLGVLRNRVVRRE
jgi:2-keto-4-pentenoate hydratase/2-oxohepta-3-ene-1,7-dioic acid hydratase in catechol pathway